MMWFLLIPIAIVWFTIGYALCYWYVWDCVKQKYPQSRVWRLLLLIGGPLDILIVIIGLILMLIYYCAVEPIGKKLFVWRPKNPLGLVKKARSVVAEGVLPSEKKEE